MEVSSLLWRTAAWTGEFGDNYLQNTEIEGGFVSPSVLQLHLRLGDIFASKDTLLKIFGYEDQETVGNAEVLTGKIHRCYFYATEVEKIQRGDADADLEDLIKTILSDLTDLSVGQYLIIPSGWLAVASAHFVAFIIQREVDFDQGTTDVDRRRFTFTVVNTGEGLQFHSRDFVTDDGTTKERARSFVLRQVCGYRLLDPSLIFFLLKQNLSSQSYHGPRSIYDVVVMHLAGERLDDHDAPDGGDMPAPLKSVQKSGTCYFRGLNASVKFICENIFGWNLQKTKRLMLALRCAYLVAAEDQLTEECVRLQTEQQRSLPFNSLKSPALLDSDVNLINLGLQQTARAVGKAVLRNHVDQSCLLLVEKVAESLRERMAKYLELSDRLGSSNMPGTLNWAVADAHLNTSNDRSLLKWPHFELISSIGSVDTEPFAGVSVSTNPDLFADFMPQVPSGPLWTFEDVELALKRAVKQVREERSKISQLGLGFGANRFYSIISCIEELVLKIVPTPCGYVDARAVGIGWNSVEKRGVLPVMSLQQSVMKLAGELIRNYLAAINSCPMREGGVGPEIIVCASLLVICDAAARTPVITTYKPLPIFTVLTSGIYSQYYGDNGGVSNRRFGVPVTVDDLDSDMIMDSMILDPTFLKKRKELRQYVVSLNGHSDSSIPFVGNLQSFSTSGNHSWNYTYVPRVTFNFVEEDIEDSLSFVKAYMEEAQLPEIPPILYETKQKNLEIGYQLSKQTASTIPEIWKVAAWIADEHANSQDFGVYRDVAFAYWASLYPPKDLRDPLKGILEPSMFQPHFRPEAIWPMESQQSLPDMLAIECRMGRIDLDIKTGVELAWTRKALSRNEFQVGSRVLARYRDKSAWVPGKIFQIDSESGYNIEFSGGYEELYVPYYRVKPIEGVMGYSPVDTWNIAQVQIIGRPTPESAAAIAEQSTALASELKPFLVDPDFPTETDVLFTPDPELATFGGVLSREEAFRLATIMTASRIRIPLILKFFADRTTVLSHRPLQRLVMSVLFEPTSLSDLQENSEDTTGFAGLGPFATVPMYPEFVNSYLGSDQGLLLLELISAPGPVMQPIFDIISNIHYRSLEVEGDQNSESFVMVLWAVVLTARIEGFVRFAISEVQQKEALMFDGSILSQLEKYLLILREKVVGLEIFLVRNIKTAEKTGDIAGMAAIHAHILLLRAFADDEEMRGSINGKDKVNIDAYDLTKTGYAAHMFSMSFAMFYMKAIDTELNRLNVTPGFSPVPAVRGQYKLDVSDTPRAVLLCVPWFDVFGAVARHRVRLISWLQELEGASVIASGELIPKFDALDVLLSQVLRVTMRDGRCNLRKWSSLRSSKSASHRQCERILESPHPYPNGTEVYTRVSFPGASTITVTFDAKTSLEGHTSDYIEIFKDESLSSMWAKLSGSSKLMWPGRGTAPPLVIPNDFFIFHFKSDQSVNDWGFKMKLVAPINEDLKGGLFDGGWKEVIKKSAKITSGSLVVTEDEISSFNKISLDSVEKALAVSWNHESLACDWLLEHRYDLQHASENEDESTVHDPRSKVDERLGLYRTDDGMYECNCQNFDLFCRSRLPVPLPADLLNNVDFDAVFIRGVTACVKDTKEENTGDLVIDDASRIGPRSTSNDEASFMCTQLVANANRQWLSVSRNGILYDLHVWKALDLTTEYLLEEEIDKNFLILHTSELETTYCAHNWPRWVSLNPDHPSYAKSIEGDGVILPEVDFKPGSKEVNEYETAFRVLREQMRLYRPVLSTKSAALAYNHKCYTRSYVPGCGYLGSSGFVLDFSLRRHFGLLRFKDEVARGKELKQFTLGPYIGQKECPSDAAFILLSDTVDLSILSNKLNSQDQISHLEPISLLMWLPAVLFCDGSDSSTSKKTVQDAFFEVLLTPYADNPVCEIYQLIDHGRCTQRSLVFTSDTRSSLRYINTDLLHRKCPLPDEVKFAGGHLLGGHVTYVNQIGNDVLSKRINPRNPYQESESDYELRSEVGQDTNILGLSNISYSGVAFMKRRGDLHGKPTEVKMASILLIQRHVSAYYSDIQDKRRWRETFIPFRDLAGLVPEVLFQQYEFWMRSAIESSFGVDLEEPLVIVGYPVLKKSSTSSFQDSQNSIGYCESELMTITINRISGLAEISLPDSNGSIASVSKLVDSETGCSTDTSVLTVSNRIHLLPAAKFSPKTPLGRLMSVLQRVESASHILIWARGYNEGVDGAAKGFVVEKVELPRLRLSFTVTKTASGKILFQSVEYVGYWLSDTRGKRLQELITGIPFQLILENEDICLAIVVPTFSVICPPVERLPFCAELVPYRSAAWTKNVTSRTLIYRIHRSITFFENLDCVHALHYFTLLLASRFYNKAAKMFHMVGTMQGPPDDSANWAEQAWLFSQSLLTAADTHPNAVALRMKLVLLIFNVCGNTLAVGNSLKSRDVFPSPYGMLSIGNGDPSGVAYNTFLKIINTNEEHVCPNCVRVNFDPTCLMCGYELYLGRIGHVSPCCRLSLEDEISCQALATSIGSKYVQFYSSSKVKLRDTFLMNTMTKNRDFEYKEFRREVPGKILSSLFRSAEHSKSKDFSRKMNYVPQLVGGAKSVIGYISDVNTRSLEKLKKMKQAQARRGRSFQSLEDSKPQIIDNIGIIINLLSCYKNEKGKILPPITLLGSDVDILNSENIELANLSDMRLSPIESGRSLGALLAREYLVIGNDAASSDPNGVFKMAVKYNRVYEDTIIAMFFVSETLLALNHKAIQYKVRSTKIIPQIQAYLSAFKASDTVSSHHLSEASALLKKLKEQSEESTRANDLIALRRNLMLCLDSRWRPFQPQGRDDEEDKSLKFDVTTISTLFQSVGQEINPETLGNEISSFYQTLRHKKLALRSEGKFRHPGSWESCGGNPEGFANCQGEGRCLLSGAGKCNNCGAGSHWTCCSSTDQTSIWCSGATTYDQATQNHRILSRKSRGYTRVSDITGFICMVERTDWSCPACTSVNELSVTVCSVCDTPKSKDEEDVSSDDGGSSSSSSSDDDRRNVHDIPEDDQCMICSNCSLCSGFGANCVNCRGKDRSGDKGQQCGCGDGKGNCRGCGMCEACCDANKSSCTGVKGTKDVDENEDFVRGLNQTHASVYRIHSRELLSKIYHIALEAGIDDIEYPNLREEWNSVRSLVEAVGSSIPILMLFSRLTDSQDTNEISPRFMLPTADRELQRTSNRSLDVLRSSLISYMVPVSRVVEPDTKRSQIVVNMTENDISTIVAPLQEIYSQFRSRVSDFEQTLSQDGNSVVEKNCEILMKLTKHSIFKTSTGKRLIDRNVSALKDSSPASNRSLSWWHHILDLKTSGYLNLIEEQLGFLSRDLSILITHLQDSIEKFQTCFEEFLSKTPIHSRQIDDEGSAVNATISLLQRVDFLSIITIPELVGAILSSKLDDVIFSKDHTFDKYFPYFENFGDYDSMSINVVYWSILNVNHSHAIATLRIVNAMQELVRDAKFGELSRIENDKIAGTRALYLLEMEANGLMNRLRQCRSYVDCLDKNSIKIDPRYAYIEFTLSSLLRNRQVELLADFRTGISERKSGVTQLIMGQGKTQVLCPALALLIADGSRSVTLITPRQLSRQSEDALNSFLCNSLLNRPPLTFVFNRSTGKIPTQFSSLRSQQPGMTFKVDDEVLVNTGGGEIVLGKIKSVAENGLYGVLVEQKVLQDVPSVNLKRYCESNLKMNAKFARLIKKTYEDEDPDQFPKLYILCFPKTQEYTDSEFQLFVQYYQDVTKRNNESSDSFTSILQKDIEKGLNLKLTSTLKKKYATMLLTALEHEPDNFDALRKACDLSKFNDDEILLFGTYLDDVRSSVSSSADGVAMTDLKRKFEKHANCTLEDLDEEENISDVAVDLSASSFGKILDSSLDSYVQSSISIPSSVGLLLARALHAIYSCNPNYLEIKKDLICSRWPLKGTYSDRGVAEVNYIYRRLLVAVKNGSAILTTPDAIKCTLLAYVDLLSAEKLASISLLSDREKLEHYVQSLDGKNLRSLAHDNFRFLEIGIGFSSWIQTQDANELGQLNEEQCITKFLSVTKNDEIRELIIRSLDRTTFGIEQSNHFFKFVEEKIEGRELLGTSADQVSNIINVFRGISSNSSDEALLPGVAIVDEFDSVLDPIRSELNFPIGVKREYHIFRARAEIQIYVSEVMTTAASLAVGFKFQSSDQDTLLLHLKQEFSNLFFSAKGFSSGQELISSLSKGEHDKVLLMSPHLIILRADWYTESLLPCLSMIAIGWLANFGNFSDFNKSLLSWKSSDPSVDVESQLAQFLGAPPLSRNAFTLGEEYYATLRKNIMEHFSPEGRELINLAQSVLCKVLPHILSKTNCVHYGLLRLNLDGNFCIDTNQTEPPSRALLAVPFTGKDTPSKNSEFASPDIRLMSTAFAYKYQGLRLPDVSSLVRNLKLQLKNEVGPVVYRQQYIIFSDWLSIAIAQGGDSKKAAESVPSLDLFPVGDVRALENLTVAICRVSAAIKMHLLFNAFERTSTTQHEQFGSSGHDIASDILFGVRLGFTGTPNDFVPLSMVRESGVKYQMSEEKAIFMTLSNESIIETNCYSSEVSESVINRLYWISSNKTFSALIDVGATITGLNNKQAAAALLVLGLSRFEGVVFLDSSDRKRVLVRQRFGITDISESSNSSGVCRSQSVARTESDDMVALFRRMSSSESVIEENSQRFRTIDELRDAEEFKSLMQSKDVPLERCGIPKDKLFVLFDQTHSTGCHIDMAIDAVGCITISKDVTYRDWAQGAYRMRALGSGQRLAIALSPEIQDLARNQLREVPDLHLPDDGTPLSPIYLLSWLLMNGARMEDLGSASFAFQRLNHVFREPALSALLSTKAALSPKVSSSLGINIETFEEINDFKSIRWKISEDVLIKIHDDPLRKKISGGEYPVKSESIGFNGLLSSALRAFVSFNLSQIPNTIEDPANFKELLLVRVKENTLMARISGLNFIASDKCSFVEDDMELIFQGNAEDKQVNTFDQEILQEQEEEQEKLNELDIIVITESKYEEPLDPVGMTPWRISDLLVLGSSIPGEEAVQRLVANNSADDSKKAIVLIMKYIFNIIRSFDAIDFRQIGFHNQRFASTLCKVGVLDIFFAIGFRGGVISLKEEQTHSLEKNASLLLVIRAQLGNDIDNALRLEKPSTAEENSMQMSRLIECYFMLQYTAECLGNQADVLPDSFVLKEKDVDLDLKEKFDAKRRILRCFSRVDHFHVDGLRLPGNNLLFVSPNHTRRQTHARNIPWDLPQKLRDSIFLLTIENEVENTSSGLLINILEAETVRRSLWNLKTKTTIKVSLWLVPETATSPTLTSLLATGYLPAPTPISSEFVSDVHEIEKLPHAVPIYSAFCRFLSGYVRFSVEESNILLSNRVFEIADKQRKASLAKELLSSRPRDNTQLGFVFSFTSSAEWIEAAQTIRDINKAILFIYKNPESFFNQLSSDDTINLSGKSLDVSIVLSMLRADSFQMYAETNHVENYDSCILRFSDILIKLGFSSKLKFNEFANILSLGLQDSQKNGILIDNDGRLDVVQRLTSLYVDGDSRRIAVTNSTEESSRKIQLQISDQPGPPLEPFGATSVATSKIPLHRQVSMDQYSLRGVATAEASTGYARQRQERIARKSLARMFLDDADSLDRFGLFSATGFSKSFGYDIVEGKAKAIVFDSHILPSVTLSDSGVMDLGTFSPALYPVDHIIQQNDSVASGSVTVFPRGVSVPIGSTFFQARILSSVDKPKILEAGTKKNAIVPLIAVGIMPTYLIGTFPGINLSTNSTVSIREGELESIPPLDASEGILLAAVTREDRHRCLALFSKNSIIQFNDIDFVENNAIGCIMSMNGEEKSIEFLLPNCRDSSTKTMRIPFFLDPSKASVLFAPILWSQIHPSIDVCHLSAKLEIFKRPGEDDTGSSCFDNHVFPEGCQWLQTPGWTKLNERLLSFYGDHHGTWYQVSNEATLEIQNLRTPTITSISGDFTHKCVCITFGVVVTHGKWYYECSIDNSCSENIDVGWRDARWGSIATKNKDIWVLNSILATTTHRTKKQVDVFSGRNREATIGICLDCDGGTISYISDNKPQFVAFYDVKAPFGLVPVLFITEINKNRPAVKLNNGEDGIDDFVFCPPPGYKPICLWKPRPEYFALKTNNLLNHLAIEDYNGQHNIRLYKKSAAKEVLKTVLTSSEQKLMGDIPGVLVASKAGLANVSIRSSDPDDENISFGFRFINSGSYSAVGLVSSDVSIRSDMGIDMLNPEAGGVLLALMNVPTSFDFDLLRNHNPYDAQKLSLESSAIDLAHISDKFYKGQFVRVKNKSAATVEKMVRKSPTCPFDRDMLGMIGKVGVVVNVGQEISVEIANSKSKFYWVRDLVEGEITIGAEVKIKSIAAAQAEKLMKDHGGFNSAMSKMLGKKGIVSDVNGPQVGIEIEVTKTVKWIRELLEPISGEQKCTDDVALDLNGPGLYLITRGVDVDVGVGVQSSVTSSSAFLPFSDSDELARLRQRLSKDEFKRVLETVLKILGNIKREPGAPKFRLLNKDNALVAGTLLANQEAMDILYSAGFEMNDSRIELKLLDQDRLNRAISIVQAALEQNSLSAATRLLNACKLGGPAVLVTELRSQNVLVTKLRGPLTFENSVSLVWQPSQGMASFSLGEEQDFCIDLSQCLTKENFAHWKPAASVGTSYKEVTIPGGDPIVEQTVGAIYIEGDTRDAPTETHTIFCSKKHEMIFISDEEDWDCGICSRGKQDSPEGRHACFECNEHCCLDCVSTWRVQNRTKSRGNTGGGKNEIDELLAAAGGGGDCSIQ